LHDVLLIGERFVDEFMIGDGDYKGIATRRRRVSTETRGALRCLAILSSTRPADCVRSFIALWRIA